MWKIYSEDKIEVLKKTQENLEASQKNNQMLVDVLQTLVNVSNKSEEVVAERTEEEKKLAAYALNLCTVSVSQIIDYNDIQFLEYEYDAILNNLNLEKMPKDEALLRILKQLLDVITFFRIQDGDRQMMEKEYEQRMKDAIWSAIPNPTMIVAGGSPLAIGLSLASQVGIGYMNYRKEKAKVALDKDRKEWELQRSAMEQFNGLRRELFDTAWRLADEYNFPDEYRITERQISQYNTILLDTDNLRRYERLNYISKSFQAYAPFWYYLGSAANSVCQDERYSETIREDFKKRATDNFRYFFSLTEHNLLREDQLVASCALEFFDLVEDKTEKLHLLDKAIISSGNAFDVLQICAISYLKIGEVDKACDLLKMLVNEEYNQILNVQLLSRLYVSRVLDGDKEYIDKYELLAMRFTKKEYLFPLPKELPQNDEERSLLADTFIQQQKSNLRLNYAVAMKSYVMSCENRYYEICRYDGNITSEIAELIKDISNAVKGLVGNKSTFFLVKVKNAVTNNIPFKKMLEDSEGRIKGKNNVAFADIFANGFTYIASEIAYQINGVCDMSEVSILENELHTFIVENEVQGKQLMTYKEINTIEEVFGGVFLEDLERSKLVNNFISVMKDNGISQTSIVIKSDNLEFIIRGEAKFKPYLERNRDTFGKVASDDEIIAILNDTSARDTDIIFTTSMAIVTGWFGVKGQSHFKDICMDKSGDRLAIGDCKYNNGNVNMNNLYRMMRLFAELTNNTRDSNRGLSEDVYKRILISR